ncbi:MAG: exosortase/archaeosortase family protein [Candidatus Micrarchaeaceae archaeon]
MEFRWRFGLVLFAALLALMLVFSAAITQPYISDTNPSTYVIIPILMLPIFALFMLKHSGSLAPKVDSRSLVLGTVLFVMLIALALDLRGYLGPMFFGYRMDMLILPLGIVALASLIFGIENLGKFAWISVYALLASPLLLFPIVNQNLYFASINSGAIYHIIRAFMPSASFVAPLTIYFNGNGISIGNACVGVGALIGLLLFLLPVAYFLEGKPRRRAMWAFGGLLLMLAFNFIRMLAITIVWFAYGPNSNTLGVHAAIGQVLFYADIIIMLLIAGKFGLTYPRIWIGKPVRGYSVTGISIAIVFSFAYLLVSASYQGAASGQATVVGSTPAFNWGSVNALYGAYISYPGNSYSIIGRTNTSVEIVMVNASGPNSQVLAIFGVQNSSAESLLRGGFAPAWKEYLNGANVSYVYELNNDSNSFVYYEMVPYSQGYGSYLIDMYVISLNYSQTAQSNCQTGYEGIYGTISNIAALNINSFNRKLDMEYCSLKGIIK